MISKVIDMTEKLQPNPVIFAKALADSTRQQIMQVCCCEWLNVNQIVEAVSVNQPTVSHHLAILREAGLVKTRSEGKYTYYTLNQESLANCCGRLVLTFAPETTQAGMINIDDSLAFTIPSSIVKVTHGRGKKAAQARHPKNNLISAFLRIFRVGK
jgi:DNA-binding transcriptional ArsR family regulator